MTYVDDYKNEVKVPKSDADIIGLGENQRVHRRFKLQLAPIPSLPCGRETPKDCGGGFSDR